MSNTKRSKPYSRPTGPSTDGQWLHDRAPGSGKTTFNGDSAKKQVPAGIASKLLISNLHYEITPKDLSSIFGQIGTLVKEPLIRYDRSGRSLGTAIVSYDTPAEATNAKKQFDGILAKGQPMTIEYDNTRRAVSAPTTSSLLNRIQKPALASRLSSDDSKVKTPSNGPGPIRNKPARGPKKGKGPKKPATVEDLDKELDAFMGDSSAAPAPTAPVAGDVEMAT